MPPGPLWSVAVVIGTAVGVTLPIRIGTAAAVVLTATGAALLLPAHRRGPALVAVIALVALTSGSMARRAALTSPVLAWFERTAHDESRAPEVVELDGVVIADAAPAEEGVRLLIRAVRLREGADWVDVDGRIQVHVGGQLAAAHIERWTAGRRIRAPVLLRRPPVWRNFGGPAETWQQLRRRFDLSGTVKSAALVEIAPGPPWHEAAARVRHRVRGAVQRLVAPRDGVAAAVAVAILIGDRAALDESITRRLQAAGTYHVIAISGGNVALVTAVCFLVLRAALRSQRWSAIVAAIVVLAYGWVVGSEPSVVRAVCAATIYLAAAAIGLRPRPLHLLLTVAASIAIGDPLMTVDVGAWLSFGATLGIVVLAPRAAGRFERSRLAGHTPRAARTVVRAAATLLAATAAAELVLSPVTASVFGRVGIAGLLLNFVAIPSMAIVQSAGLAVVVLDGIAPAAAHAAAVVLASAASALVDSARLVDVFPWLSWRVPPVPWHWSLIYYAALAVSVWSAAPRRARATAAAGTAVAGIVIVTAPDVVRGAGAPGLLRVVMLDVGQGDAILVQMPTGQAMLVDAGGSAGGFDIGTRVVTPAIWAQRVSRLEWLAITHPDQDHIGGAAPVVADLTPREVWEAIPVPRNGSRAGLRDLVHTRGLVWREVRRGERLEAGGVLVEVLHPPPPDWERQRVRNDDSLVLRLRYGDIELLLTGDAGVEFESAPLAAPAAPIRVLKAAHHGSRSSSGERFVRAYAPHVVLISAGRGNLFGHPAPDVVDRFRAAGAEIFRTDRDGAVMLEIDGRIVRARASGGRTWMTGLLRIR